MSEPLDGSGNAQASVLYDPYGNARYSSGSMPGSYGYTGQRADAATGLDDYNARYYDPAAEQFTSADSVAARGLNRYAYVAGNPETATDPTGHLFTCMDGCGGGGGSSGGPPPPPPPPTPPTGGGCTSNCGGKGGGGNPGGGCVSEHCGGDRTTYDCTNLAVAEAISACDSYTSAIHNDEQARNDALADELHHASWLIFLGTILGGIVDIVELLNGGEGVVEKIKAIVDLATTLAGGFYWLSIALGSKAGSPIVSTILRVLNGIATIGNSAISLIRELGGAAQWMIDKGWIAMQGMAEGVPGLLTDLAVALAGNTVLDLLSGGFHAMLSQGFQLYADYQSQENMDLGAWCAAHQSAGCESIPSSTVSV